MDERIRKPPRRFSSGGSFCVKSNRGIRRLCKQASHINLVVGLNKDSNDGLAVGVVYYNSVSITSGSGELANADVLASLVGVVQINVSNYYVVINSISGQLGVVALEYTVNLSRSYGVVGQSLSFVVLVNPNSLSIGAALLVNDNVAVIVDVVRGRVEGNNLLLLQALIGVNGVRGIVAGYNILRVVVAVNLLGAVCSSDFAVNGIGSRTGRTSLQLNVSSDYLVVINNVVNLGCCLSSNGLQIAQLVNLSLSKLVI